MPYRHEQVGRWLIVGLGLFAAATLAVGLANGLVFPLLFIAALEAAAALAFGRLNVTVDASGVRWGMTFGVPSGYVPMSEIASAQIVPVSFWYGIGIHLTLRGWVWNVSLGRGVQIARKGALPIVLGTDDPQGLLDAIERARAA